MRKWKKKKINEDLMKREKVVKCPSQAPPTLSKLKSFRERKKMEEERENKVVKNNSIKKKRREERFC